MAGMANSLEMLQKVAEALGPLLNEVVFVGGTIPSLLITDPAAPSLRPTKDVDIIINSLSHHSHASFEEKLRKRGFQMKPPPACRYGINDILVDVMTTTSEAMGFSERWYAEAFASAESLTLPNGIMIRVIQAPLFLATKLDAWRDRGNRDVLASPDLEDILAVIDGRDTLLDEIQQSNHDVRIFLSQHFELLLKNNDFLEAVPGHLGGDAIAHERAEKAVEVMKKIVELGHV